MYLRILLKGGQLLCRPQEAYADLEHVVQLDPTVTSAYVNLGRIAMQHLKNYRRYVSVFWFSYLLILFINRSLHEKFMCLQ